MTPLEFAERSRRIGKSEGSRWAAEGAPWLKGVMAVVEAPGLTRLVPRTPGPAPGESRADWYRRVFGEPFDADGMYSFVKHASCGMTEVLIADAKKSFALLERFEAAGRWRFGAGLDGSWLMKPNGAPVAAWEAAWLNDELIWIGVDYATDRFELSIDDWGQNKTVPQIALKPAPRKGKRELLASSANVGLNKVKSIRSTKPLNQVIRSLVVASRASPREAVRKWGHGSA